MKYKKFDAHTHIYPDAIAEKACVNLGKFYNFTVHGAGTYTALCDELKTNDYAGMFMLAVATNAHQVEKVNDTLAQAVMHARENGFDAYGFMSMHQDFEDMPREVERSSALGLSGVKLHPDIQGTAIDDKRFYPLYETIEGKLPLYLHMGDNRYPYSKADKLAKVLRDFPHLKVIAAHLGSYSEWENAACLWGNESVWYDLSSTLWAIPPEQVMHFIECCGFDRVMYGTDYPVCHIAEYEALFEALPLTDQQRADIYYNNAMRFLRS